MARGVGGEQASLRSSHQYRRRDYCHSPCTSRHRRGRSLECEKKGRRPTASCVSERCAPQWPADHDKATRRTRRITREQMLASLSSHVSVMCFDIGITTTTGHDALGTALLKPSPPSDVNATLVDDCGRTEEYTSCTDQSRCHFQHALHDFRRVIHDPELLRIASTIAVFTTDLKLWYETGKCAVDSLELQKHASLLLYRLFNWHQNQEGTIFHANACTSPVDRSICLALLIFMVYATEPNAGSLSGRLLKATIKLRFCVQQVPMSQWVSEPNLFFWILSMGALGAESPSKGRTLPDLGSELMFFRDYLRRAFPTETCNHATSAEYLLRRARECLWIPSILDERAKAMWTAMG